MVIDCRSKKNPLKPLKIKQETVEIIEIYKYLGFTTNNNLNWHVHIDTLCKKINQRLFFLKKLKSFRINSNILTLFYQAVIQSVITFGISCWGGSITEWDKHRINRAIKKAEKIVGCELTSFNDLYRKNSLYKAMHIANDPSHPLYNDYLISGRSGRFITIQSKTERYRKSFVPSTARKLSESKVLRKL